MLVHMCAHICFPSVATCGHFTLVATSPAVFSLPHCRPFMEFVILLRLVSCSQPPSSVLPLLAPSCPCYNAGLPQAQLWYFWSYPFLIQNIESLPSCPAHKLWPTFSGLSSHESSIHLKIDLIMFYLFSNHLTSMYYVPSLLRDLGILWWTRSKCYCFNN